MSLINQMLQDLEKRRAAERAAQAPLPLHGASSRRRPSPAVILAVVAIVVGLTSVLFVALHSSSRPVPRITEAPVSSAPAVAATGVPPAAAPVATHRTGPELVSLRFIQGGAAPRLVAEFDAAPDYRLAADPEGGWRIALPGAREAAGLSVPRSTVAWLSQVDIDADPSGLTLHLVSRKACQATAFLLPAGEGYGNRLVISFTGPQPAVATARIAPVPVSAPIAKPKAQPVPAVAPPAIAESHPKATGSVQAAAPQTSAATPLAKTPHPMSAAEKADFALAQGQRALTVGDDAAAETLLRRALVLDPRSRSARETLVALLLKESRSAEAESLLVAGIKLVPADASFKKLYARLLVDQGEWKQALGTLQEGVVPQVADDPAYHALLAAIFQHLGDNAAAAKTYRELVGVRPQAGVWWLGLGLSEEGCGNRRAAEAGYSRAIACGDLKPALASYAKERLTVLQR